MLCIKYQGHRSLGSREKKVLRFFTIYGRAGHVGHVIRSVWAYKGLRKLCVKYGYNLISGFI